MSDEREAAHGLDDGSTARNRLRRAMLAAGLLFVGLLFHQSLPVIREQVTSIRPGALSASIAFACFNITLIALHLQRLMAQHGVSVSARTFVGVFARGQILKYIPGKLWYVVYQMNALSQPGAVKAVALANLEMMFISVTINSILAGFLLSAAVHPVLASCLAVAALAMLAYAMSSTAAYDIAVPLLQSLLERIRRGTALSERIASAKRGPLGIGWVVLFCIFFLVTQALAYRLFLVSIRIDPALVDTYAGLLLASWVLSLLAVVVPGGIGVREGGFIALAYGLSLDASFEELTAIALLARVWQLAIDLVYAAICGWLPVSSATKADS